MDVTGPSISFPAWSSAYIAWALLSYRLMLYPLSIYEGRPCENNACSNNTPLCLFSFTYFFYCASVSKRSFVCLFLFTLWLCHYLSSWFIIVSCWKSKYTHSHYFLIYLFIYFNQAIITRSQLLSTRDLVPYTCVTFTPISILIRLKCMRRLCITTSSTF